MWHPMMSHRTVARSDSVRPVLQSSSPSWERGYDVHDESEIKKIISPGAQKLTVVSAALRCDFHEVMIDEIIASVSADSISISMTTVVSAMTSKLLTRCRNDAT